jgi:hypothetical protein
VRHVSQQHFNQLFSNNKVSIKNHLVFSYLYRFIPYSFTPAVIPLGVLYLINAYTSDGQHKEPQQQRQRGQQRTEQPECQPAAPLHLLLSKCWLYKHKCFRLCSTPWSTCRLLNLKHRHRRRGIGLEIFNALSHLPFLKLWR